MTNELQQTLDDILNDKNTNLLPENLKKGVTCLGVDGTLQTSSSMEGIKQFSTIEEMQADSTAKEGDLAVVYRNEVQNMTAETQTQYITFPETVTLPEAFTDSVFTMLRAIDESVMFDGQIMLGQSGFDFQAYTETGMIMVQYESTDGITYTRTRFMGYDGDLTNPVDLETVVECPYIEEWNNNLGYFMQVGGMIFEGLFKNKIRTRSNHKETIKNPKVNDGVLSYDEKGDFDITPYADTLSQFCQDNEINSFSFICGIKDNIANLYYIKNQTMTPCIVNYNDKIHYAIFRNTSSVIDTPAHIQINLESGEVSFIENTNTPIIMQVKEKFWVQIFDEVEINTYITADLFRPTTSDLQGNVGLTYYYKAYDGSNEYRVYENLELVPEQLYMLAPNQLTLTSSSQLLPDIIAYGKDGVIEGTLADDVSNQFNDVNAEVYSKIQQQYDKLEPKILTDSDRTIDKNIRVIPMKSDGTSLLDTSNVTNMSNLFLQCFNLTSIPNLNTINVTNMKETFRECINLTLISNIDTSNVINMHSMFSGCSNLTSIPNLNTINVINMNSMFSSCSNLTSIPNLDTSNVTTMISMLAYCYNLTNIPNLNTLNVTTMVRMFENCSNLTNIPNMDTSNVLNMFYIFRNCTNLSTIPSLNTSNVTNMSSMIYNCSNLTNESLNNILYMCSVSNITNTASKTLNNIGLTQAQANICMNLSNYSIFTSAGWTTGY